MLALAFGNSSLLWLLLIVPVLAAGYVVAQRRRPAYAARFACPEHFSTVVPRRPTPAPRVPRRFRIPRPLLEGCPPPPDRPAPHPPPPLGGPPRHAARGRHPPRHRQRRKG